MRIGLVVLSALIMLYALSGGDAISLGVGVAAVFAVWTTYFAIRLVWGFLMIRRAKRG
jgi:hypothetical protein